MTTPTTTPSNNDTATTEVVETPQADSVMEDLVQGPHGQWIVDNTGELGVHILRAIQEAVDNVPAVHEIEVPAPLPPITVQCQHPAAYAPVAIQRVERLNTWPALVVALVVFIIGTVITEVFSPGWTPGLSMALAGVAGLVAFVIAIVAIISNSNGDRR